MKFSRARLAFALVLGGAALFLTWQASGQQGPALVEANTLPFSDNLLYGVGRPRDPELEKLIRAEATAAREVSKLMAEYGKAEKEEERGATRTKLTAALEKQFDAQQKRRELELTRLEAKLKKVRELMKKRSEERKVIIDKRLDQLVREAEGLGWSAPAAPRPGTSAYGSFAPAKR